MTTEIGNRELIAAVGAMAAASLIGMGTAIYYVRGRVAAAEEQEKQRARIERRKYRQKYLATAEGQRRQQMLEDKRREKEAGLQEVAYFNENDEMVITKVEKNENPKTLPAGCVKIQRGQTMNYKVEKDQMGEKFIENLERINKARVEQGEPLQEQVPAPAA